MLRCADPLKRKDGLDYGFNICCRNYYEEWFARGTKIFGPIPKEIRERVTLELFPYRQCIIINDSKFLNYIIFQILLISSLSRIRIDLT